jgi:hypothetical protein
MPPLARLLTNAPDGWMYYQDTTGQWWGMSPDGTHYLLWLIVPHRERMLRVANGARHRRAAMSE